MSALDGGQKRIRGFSIQIDRIVAATKNCSGLEQHPENFHYLLPKNKPGIAPGCNREPALQIPRDGRYYSGSCAPAELPSSCRQYDQRYIGAGICFQNGYRDILLCCDGSLSLVLRTCSAMASLPPAISSKSLSGPSTMVYFPRYIAVRSSTIGAGI